jgi:hypothetical protein
MRRPWPSEPGGSSFTRPRLAATRPQRRLVFRSRPGSVPLPGFTRRVTRWEVWSSLTALAANPLVRSAPRGTRTPPTARSVVCRRSSVWWSVVPSMLLTSQNLMLPVRLFLCGPSVGLSYSVKNSVNDCRSRVEHRIPDLVLQPATRSTGIAAVSSRTAIQRAEVAYDGARRAHGDRRRTRSRAKTSRGSSAPAVVPTAIRSATKNDPVR